MVFKKFNAINVSSKIAICGLPLRVDSYKNCSFNCRYCFSNNRKIMEFSKELQVANISQFEKTLKRVHIDKNIKENSLIDNLLNEDITLHWGGMSDPFQQIEKELGITKQLIDITNKYNKHILFSTKSDTIYNCDIRPDLHSFQLSFTSSKCCCGEPLVKKSTNFNTTAMLFSYGDEYTLENVIENCPCEIMNSKASQLFTSNRTEGCVTLEEFYNKRFNRKSSPFSPKFQVI